VACFRPLTGYRGLQVGPSGKRGLVFKRAKSFSGVEIKIPCGRCVGCRKERARQWAIRCLHEASLYDYNCFITLTFNDKYLPADRSVRVRDLQLFMKRLRRSIDRKVRFYACGEYGEKNKRPHYHILLFGVDLRGKYGENAPCLEEAWSDPGTGEEYGTIFVGDVTFGSASYVAKYIMKKRLGKKGDNPYLDMEEDEIIGERCPEFVVMSRRPGIGAEWYKKYGKEMYLDRVRAPRFYDDMLEKENPEKYWSVKWKRKVEGIKRAFDNTFDRLRDKEADATAKLKLYDRRKLDE